MASLNRMITRPMRGGLGTLRLQNMQIFNTIYFLNIKIHTYFIERQTYHYTFIYPLKDGANTHNLLE